MALRLSLGGSLDGAHREDKSEAHCCFLGNSPAAAPQLALETPTSCHCIKEPEHIHAAQITHTTVTHLVYYRRAHYPGEEHATLTSDVFIIS